jgi:hypothetical protein
MWPSITQNLTAPYRLVITNTERQVLHDSIITATGKIQHLRQDATFEKDKPVLCLFTGANGHHYFDASGPRPDVAKAFCQEAIAEFDKSESKPESKPESQKKPVICKPGQPEGEAVWTPDKPVTSVPDAFQLGNFVHQTSLDAMWPSITQNLTAPYRLVITNTERQVLHDSIITVRGEVHRLRQNMPFDGRSPVLYLFTGSNGHYYLDARGPRPDVAKAFCQEAKAEIGKAD